MDSRSQNFMEHDRIQRHIRNAPGIRLLRSDSAPLILSFLHREFKTSQRIWIPYSELVEKLDDYLEMLHEIQPELYPRSAQLYLETWCDDDHQFLRKYYDSNSDDPVFELTPGTEKALGWLEDLKGSQFIATESRFLRIFSILEEIVVRSTEDTPTRLAQLERQKEDIQKEIDRIKATGEVQRYNVTQIKERFLEANDAARRLLADFREVEQNFRDITRAVQEQQLKEGVRKGSVVKYVIDADDSLKASDQGRSFYTFWDFLLSPSKQEDLQELLERVYNLPDVQPLSEENQLLKRIKTSLIDAGEKVVQSNHRLAEQLRKVLDDRNIPEYRRVMELITEIKRHALALVENPPEEEEFIGIEGYPQVRMIMERPFWEPVEIPGFNSEDVLMADEDPWDVEMDDLYDPFHVDELSIKQRLTSLLLRKRRLTLAELTEQYPIQKGLPEILAYFSIASQSDKHRIDDTLKEDIAMLKPSDEGEKLVYVSVPQVVFSR